MRIIWRKTKKMFCKTKNITNKGNKKDKNMSLEDYECCIGSSKQALDFEATTKFIINHIQETFDSGEDITEALRMMNGLNTDEWRPTC